MLRTRTRITAGLLVLVTVTTTGCGDGGLLGGGDRAERPYQVAGQALTESEFQYGVAPRRHEGVTFQPDVVLVGDGADAVRSVTADGMTWTLDADADGVSELAPGRVMFLTSRGVGRVVDARRDGDSVQVSIAPVGITEVVRDGTFASDEPVPFDDVLTYSSEGAQWTEESPDATVTATPAAYPVPPRGAEAAPAGYAVPAGYVAPAGYAVPAGYVAPAAGAAPAPAAYPVPIRTEPVAARPAAPGVVVPVRAPAPQPPTERVAQPKPVHGVPKGVRSGWLTIDPICCRDGIGAHLTSVDAGLRLEATVLLTMKNPSARFRLAISGGKVSVAELQVHGATGIKLDIAGASTYGTDRQFDRVFTVPLDFTVPVGLILGIPFTLTATQELKVTTAFSARDGNVRASGEYSLGGTLGFGYREGSWGVHQVEGPVMKSSLLDSIRGVSVGANGVVLAYKTNFSLGIGALGFRAGLNFGFTISTGVTRGSALAQFFPLAPGTRGIDCRGATLAIDATYNVGYSIPQLVADVVNFFLRVFKAEPIAATGGIPNPPGRHHIFDRTQFEPAGCK